MAELAARYSRFKCAIENKRQLPVFPSFSTYSFIWKCGFRLLTIHDFPFTGLDAWIRKYSTNTSGGHLTCWSCLTCFLSFFPFTVFPVASSLLFADAARTGRRDGLQCRSCGDKSFVGCFVEVIVPSRRRSLAFRCQHGWNQIWMLTEGRVLCREGCTMLWRKVGAKRMYDLLDETTNVLLGSMGINRTTHTHYSDYHRRTEAEWKTVHKKDIVLDPQLQEVQQIIPRCL